MSVPAISQPPLSSSVDVLKVVVCPAFLFSGLEQESSKRLALAANATLTWQKKNDALASRLVPADYVVATVMKQMTLKSQLADGGEIHRFGVFKQFRFGDYSSNTASPVVSEARTANVSQSRPRTEQFVADERFCLVIQSASQSKQ